MTTFDFDHLQDGAWMVWRDGAHIGTLLRVRTRWEAFGPSGTHLVDEDRRPLHFRSRQAAAEALERLQWP